MNIIYAIGNKSFYESDEDNIPFDDDLSKVPDKRPTVTRPTRYSLALNSRKQDLIRQIKSQASPKFQNTQYGLYTGDDALFLGNERVKIIGNKGQFSFVVKGKEFDQTDGLTSLLLHEKPAHYNEKDMKAYKHMLLLTSAHKNNFDVKGDTKLWSRKV